MARRTHTLSNDIPKSYYFDPWTQKFHINEEQVEREPVIRKDKTMKTRNAAILLDDAITTIGVKYNSSSGVYTFLCRKELADELRVDDYVLANSSNGYGVAKVIRIDEEAEIGLDDNIEYKWVFQRVDVEQAKYLEEALCTSEKSLRGMQREALRAQIRQQVEQGKLIEALAKEQDDD